MANTYDPTAPNPDDEEEARRLARIAEEQLRAQAQAPPPPPMPAMPAEPPRASNLDFTEAMRIGGTNMDPLGRTVPQFGPLQSHAFAAFNPLHEGQSQAQTVADAFVDSLIRYNATPRNEAMFAAPASMMGQITPGSISIAEEDDLIRRGLLPPIEARGRAPQAAAAPEPVAPITPGGFPLGQGAAEPQGREERAMRKTDLRGTEAAQAPSFQDNERAIQAVRDGAAPIGQTEPDPDGKTYPVLGELRDVLNNPYRLVEVGPGDIRVYDPGTGRWFDYNEDDWSIAGQRRRRA